MKRLLINGDAHLQKGTKIEYGDEELICFSVTRNGDYHGPRRVQLACIVGVRISHQSESARDKKKAV